MKQEYDFSIGERGRFYRKGASLSLPDSDEKPNWSGPAGQIGRFIVKEAGRTLDSYLAQPHRIAEDANGEHFTAHGGYAHRQLFELVQNSADALLHAPKGRSILIRLTDRCLYCADDGEPIAQDGVTALMFSYMSPKRDPRQIGRFGLGFKSVLGVTDTPEFYSRSGSFRFDRRRAEERIATVERRVGLDNAECYPVLRLPEPINPRDLRNQDEELRELMSWATNIVRLPLKPNAHNDLIRQIRDFPPEFLLFVGHVRYLTLEDGENSRDFILEDRKSALHLDSGNGVARWRRFKTIHCLSATARSDRPSRVDSDEVPIWWAAPLDPSTDASHFWAYLPTQTASLVAGILNAPWKTNEDRQNLLPGPYNEELIEAAAEMIAEALPKLAAEDDPARHLDALPRRRDGADPEQADLLRTRLLEHLCGSEVVPDQDGRLRAIEDISYPPKELTDSAETAPLDRWAAYPDRPRDWLHHSAVTRNRVRRLAAINRLFPPRWRGDDRRAPQVSMAKWLEALVDGKDGNDAIRASMAAIQTAVLLPQEIRARADLGAIVLTSVGTLRKPDPEHLFLPNDLLIDGTALNQDSYVHSELVSDPDTLSSLKALGLKAPSPESRFRFVARQVLQSGGGDEADEELQRQFWTSSRKLSTEAAEAMIRERKNCDGREIWPTKLRARTRTGTWQPLDAVLLPGEVVPGDGCRDDDATLDHFHEPDEKLLLTLGATDAPHSGRDLSLEPGYASFLNSCRQRYSKQDDLPHHPQESLLNFTSNKGAGPLEILSVLSDEGRWRYTDALLSLDACYERWTMRHAGTNRGTYPKMAFESLTTHSLRKHGRVRTAHGIVPLADALGPSPKSPEALHALLVHPMADKIKSAFDLVEPTPEFFGEGYRAPLIDVWPGLMGFLPSNRRQCCLVSCERILVAGQAKECVFHVPDIYLVGTVDDEEQRKLKLIANELELGLNSNQIETIVQRRTPREVEKRREVIRQCCSDAERLLFAVGERELRSDLPDSLLAVLESNGTTLSGTEIAEVAIATYHTETLKHYGWALKNLDPPTQWAGSSRAVQFVQSLGFSAEWAGERNEKRDPFLEVEGPHSLPELHDYQRTIVDNIRNLLSDGHGNGAERRAMLSMPTGSGKTRVAVQAIVETMRDDGFRGGILWVADRDELCEQAVESWKQVWSSIGTEAVQLRISRMWEGQPPPISTNALHVIVATIQTLHARLGKVAGGYGFLADFRLVVFDEAHRSIAPTFTSVMGEIGLTRFQGPDEPFMIGLTATPYRGHDEDETARLVRRYGNKRLDSGAFASDECENVIGELQEMGVLAQADHETIEGETFPLDAILSGSLAKKEVERILDKWRALPWLPESVEKRIAQSPERTKRIVEAHRAHVEPDWPTLIFATSVEHSKILAALLNREGIRSRSVSAATETVTRRRIVEEFRHGEIAALVNYGVFREGFDAPKTRAIIVARPVYSPNLYFQMIGRGLRGPLNGGEDRCLILNVRDNIENFDRALAFSELDWLWA